MKNWKNLFFYSNEFKNNEYFKNLLQLLNIKIYKLSLLGLFMNKILIQYLNKKFNKYNHSKIKDEIILNI